MYKLCIDLGGTFIKSGLTKDGISLTELRETKTPSTGPEILDALIKLSGEYLESVKTIDAICISCTGAVDSRNGVISSSNDTIPDYVGLPLRERIENAFHIPCHVENDANCAGLAEYYLGAGRSVWKGSSIERNAGMLMLTIGTGIGGAFIRNDELLTGACFTACEVGEMTLHHDTFEHQCSTSALVNRVSAYYPGFSEIDGKWIFERILKNDPVCIRETDKMCALLGEGIANIVCVLNPSLVIIGGGISAQSEYMKPRILETMAHYLEPEIFKHTKLGFAELQNDAGMLGAYYASLSSGLFHCSEKSMESVKGKLIVSCQALPEEPLHSSYIMSRMALAASEGGAACIRANSPEDITEIRKTVDLPMIGIIKREYPDSPVYITATMKEVDELMALPVGIRPEVIALDATDRIRPGNLTLKEFFRKIKVKYPKQKWMADCSTPSEASKADRLGFDFIGTTMIGYTEESKGLRVDANDFELIKDILSTVSHPVIAEGNIDTPEKAKRVIELGVYAVVVGGAITRPLQVTKKFVKAIDEVRS